MKLKIKNLNRGLLVSIIISLLVLILGTYAWLSWKSRETELKLTVGRINDIRVTISPYKINASILPALSYEEEEYASVEATNNSDDVREMEVYYVISEIDSKLVNENFKYTITRSIDNGNTYTEYKSGDFSSAVVSEKFIILTEEIPADTKYQYRIYTWLYSEDIDENDYIGSSFIGELNVGIPSEPPKVQPEEPIIQDGLIPVKLTDNATDGYVVTTVATDDSSWYNYDNKEWANAILVTDESRSSYLNNPNVVVDQSDILAYFVWIPRYAYQIWTTDPTTTSEAHLIGIKWETEEEEYTNGLEVGEYRTHPAFWWDEDGDRQIDSGETKNGIWVGKFETTQGTASNVGKTNPTILPGVDPWGGITDEVGENVASQFINSLKFTGASLNNNVVVQGNGTSQYGLTSNYDSHMMKNSEWGAVAYLTYSQYGIGFDKRYSSYYHPTGTGIFCEEEIDFTYIIYGSDNISYPHSTTGNITGIFEMFISKFEYVMGNYYNLNAGSGFSEEWLTQSSNQKYYDLYLLNSTDDIYSSTSINNCTIPMCGGHALFETIGWEPDVYNDGFNQNESIYMIGDPNVPWSWAMRNGWMESGKLAGILSFSAYEGNTLGMSSFHVVLIS